MAQWAPPKYAPGLEAPFLALFYLLKLLEFDVS